MVHSHKMRCRHVEYCIKHSLLNRFETDDMDVPLVFFSNLFIALHAFGMLIFLLETYYDLKLPT